MLSDRVRRIVHYSHYLDPEVLRCFQVDVVKAGAAQRDELRAAVHERLQHGGIRTIVDEDTHGAMVRGEADRLDVERDIEILETMMMPRVRGIQILAVVRLGAEDGYVHDDLRGKFDQECRVRSLRLVIALSTGERRGDLHEQNLCDGHRRENHRVADVRAVGRRNAIGKGEDRGIARRAA